MEAWQKDHIQGNLVMLYETTNCNTKLLAKLQTAKILDKEEVQKLELPCKTPMEKAKLLYDYVVTRKDSYMILMHALYQTNQSGAVEILKNLNVNAATQSQIPSDATEFFKTVCVDDLHRFSKDTCHVEENNWQQFTLAWNKERLSELTAFNFDFLENLRQVEAVDDFNFKKIERCVMQNRLSSIFQVRLTTQNLYQILMTVLRKTHQKESLAILEEGCDKSEQWKAPGAHLKSTDFNSIAEAIGYNCDVYVLKHLYHYTQDESLFFQKSDKFELENLLHVAAGCGHIDAVEYLLSIGLDINSRDTRNSTPLHYVGCYGGDPVSVTKVLLENGAHLFARDRDNKTVAHWITEHVTPKQYHNWVKFILDMGLVSLFNDNIRGFLDITPIHCALFNLEFSWETLMLFSPELNAEFNVGNKFGKTGLHYARDGGQSDSVLEWIYGLGGDWERENRKCISRLHVSIQCNNLEAENRFLSLGIDPNIPSNDGYRDIIQPWLLSKRNQRIAENSLSFPGDDKWVCSSDGSLPEDVVIAGYEGDKRIAVIRGHYGIHLIPGKFVEGDAYGYVCFHAAEHQLDLLTNVEFLTKPPGTYRWVNASTGNIPPGTVTTGYDYVAGCKHYIGRASINGGYVAGKVNVNNTRTCYIPLGGKEHECSKYELLVDNSMVAMASK